MIESVFNKIVTKQSLSKDDALILLNIKNTASDFYRLLSLSNELSRIEYKNKGYIFAQIGINSVPCSGGCKFCSLAENSFSVDTQFEKDVSQVIAEAKNLAKEDIEALFLMTTADYDKDKFLVVGKAVRAVLPQKIHLAANIGDFNFAYANKLKSAGFTAAYHVCRLREGTDTNIDKNQRITTLDAIKAFILLHRADRGRAYICAWCEFSTYGILWRRQSPTR